MILSKIDKKVAKQLIDLGLQKEISYALQHFYGIMNNWKNGSLDDKAAYLELYDSITDFDNHVASRYDGLTGSRYFNVVVQLLYDRIISKSNLSEFSPEVRKELERYVKPEIVSQSDGKILQFKIILNGSKPLIWRRFQVEDSMSFYDLHLVIQNVMGWMNSHLYEFIYEKNNFIGNPELLERDDVANDKETILSAIFDKTGINIIYEYDFGDSWTHKLVLEKILEKNPSQFYPYCMEGEMNCPPEDSGGIAGYYFMMETIKNKNHPEYNEIKTWLGRGYDMGKFDLKLINKFLKNYRDIDPDGN